MWRFLSKIELFSDSIITAITELVIILLQIHYISSAWFFLYFSSESEDQYYKCPWLSPLIQLWYYYYDLLGEYQSVSLSRYISCYLRKHLISFALLIIRTKLSISLVLFKAYSTLYTNLLFWTYRLYWSIRSISTSCHL